MGRRSVQLSSVLLAAVLFCWPAWVLADKGIAVYDGQELANAVTQLKTQNNGTITLAVPYISLRNATWGFVPTGRPNTSQLVTIQASPMSTLPVVLDTGLRFGLTFPGSQPAKMLLRNFTMVNLCEWNFPRAGMRYSTTSFALGIFFVSRQVQSQIYNGMVFYGRRIDMLSALYLALAIKTTFIEVVESTEWLTEDLIKVEPIIGKITRYTVEAVSFSLPAILATNISYKALEDLNDDLLVAMRASKTLLPSTFCNGTLLPESILNSTVDLTIAPVFTVFTGAELATAIGTALDVYTTNATMGLIPAVYVGESMTVDAIQAPVQVPDLLWILGPLNDIPALAVEAVLHLSDKEGVFVMQPGAKLLLQQLTLGGLAALSKNPAGGNMAPLQSPSALPLHAFQSSADPSTWATQPFLWLNNVTIILPTDDYLALLAIVLQLPPTMPSNMDAENVREGLQIEQNTTIATMTARLRVGISALVLQAVAPLRDSFTLEMLTAWGINGTVLTFKSVDGTNVSIPVLSYEQQSSSENDHRAVITGVAVGVGVPLLLAAGALAFCFARRPKCPPDASSTCSNKTTNLDVTGYTCDKMSHTTITTLGTATINHGHSSSASARSSAMHISCHVPRSTLEQHVQVRERAAASQLGVESLYSGLLPKNLPLGPHHQGSSNSSGTRSNDSCSRPRRSAQGVGDECSTVGSVNIGAGVPLSAGLPPVSPGQQMGVGRIPEAFEDLGHADLAMVTPLISEALPKVEGPPREPTTSQSQPQEQQLAPSVSAPSGGLVEGTSTHHRIQTLAAKLIDGGGANQVFIKNVIGHGSYGTVYSGIWRGLPVAIKTMVFNARDMQVGTPAALSKGGNANTSQSQTQPMKRTARAIMEAAIAASVGHPNVVATYTYDCKAMGTDMRVTTPGGLQITEQHAVQDPLAAQATDKDFKMYLVQELCGNSLESALTNNALRCPGNKQTDKLAVLSVLLDVAMGLEYLHSNNIIHADLKPGNVLLKLDTHSPVGVVAKLADFGFSAHIEPMATHISQHNSGSPFYVAPEIVQQWRASPASDIFSYGVLMWQTWNGTPPFVMAPQGGYMFDPHFPHYFPPDIPPTLYSDLMLQCLEYDSRRRPTARQLITILSQVKTSL